MDSQPTPLIKRIDWATALFLVGTPLAAAILTPLHIYFFGLDWRVLFFFAFYCVVTSVSITAGYHRLLAHKSYEANPLVRLIFLLFGAAAFQGPAIQWCSDHRRHHRFVDTDGDPYNIKRGFFFAHIGWLFLKDTARYREPLAPDLLGDPLIKWQHRYYVPVSLVMGFGFPWLMGLCLGSPMGGLIFGGILRAVFTQHCTFLINSLSHTLGRQPYSDTNSARDNIFMAFFSYGEGYHNFHHRFQTDYRNGSRWYHWDPTKWTIRLLWLLGAARRLRVVSSWEILRAKLQMDSQRLLQRGFPEERISSLRHRIEETQDRVRKLKEDYRTLKQNVKIVSRRHFLGLKADLKAARLEFKTACAQWSLYKKYFDAIPRAAF